MKNFLILLSEKQPHLLNDHLLKTYIGYLKQLRTKGHLPLCGPFTDKKGAVLIINADSIDQAEKIIKEDPFIKENYYRKFVINEFIAADDANNWLANIP